MRTTLKILCLLFCAQVFAKDFYISIGNLKYELSLHKYTRNLAVTNYLSYKDMGNLSRTELVLEKREDNFLKFEADANSGNDATKPEEVLPVFLNREGFATCLVESVSIYATDLFAKNLTKSQEADLLLQTKSCTTFLSQEYTFPENLNIFFFTSMYKKVDDASKLIVLDLFLTSLKIKIGDDERFAARSLLSMISYDVEFEKTQNINLEYYKAKLKEQIQISAENFKNEIEANSEYIKSDVDTAKLSEVVDKI